MLQFAQNSQTVLDYLAAHMDTTSAQYALCHSCFHKFKQYLVDNKLDYSISIAERWLETQSYLSKTSKIAYKKAILRLDDIYQYGAISPENMFRRPLPDSMLASINSFCEHISNSCSESHLVNIRKRLFYFCRYLRDYRECTQINNISYSDVLSFYSDKLLTLCKADITMYKGSIQMYLKWLGETGICTIGFSIILEYNHVNKVVRLAEFPESEQSEILHLGKNMLPAFPPNMVYNASKLFVEELIQAGYSNTMRTTAKSTLETFFVYLDMHQIGYHPTIVWHWYEHVKVAFGENALMCRRVIALFDRYLSRGELLFSNQFSYSTSSDDDVAPWFLEPLNSFLDLKRREGKAHSTVTMYHSAAIRFYQYLTNNGINSLTQITPETLKEFNLKDFHRTVEGKNAYNVRIRKFLLYLGGKGYLSTPYMFTALPPQKAEKVSIIRVLSDDETLKLESCSCRKDAGLNLRNRAIIQLGLKMGLRATDVVNLQLNQIDWHNKTIRFVQQKTHVEMLLPFPTDVGNALYLYLTNGRPQSNSPYIFIAHKAPYGRISSTVCTRIIQDAFLGENNPPKGFHITRKTYATNRFRNDCGYSTVADLLGHTDTETVHKYISLDEERMRLCPLSIVSSGIPFVGGFRNE